MKDPHFILPGLDGIRQRTVLHSIRQLARRSTDTPPVLTAEVTDLLLAELVSKFPDVCPAEDQSHEDVCRKQGEQRVIRLLIRAYYEQNPEPK